jgi:hypothetical protein
MDAQHIKTQSTLRNTTLDYSSFRSKFFSSHQCHQYHYYYSQYYSQPRLTHVNFFERIMKKDNKDSTTTIKKKSIVKEKEEETLALSIETMDKILTDNQIEYGDGEESDDYNDETTRKVSPLFTSNDSLFSSSQSSIYFKSNASSSSLSINNKNNMTEEENIQSKLWSPSLVSSATTKSSRSSIEDLEWEPILSNENIYDRLCDYNTNLMDSLKLTHIKSLSENDLLFCTNNKSSGYGTTTSQSMDSLSNCSCDDDDDDNIEEEESMCSRIMKGSHSFMSCQSFDDLNDNDDTISLAQTSTKSSSLSSTKRESSDLKYVLVLFEQNKSKPSSSKVSRVYTNSSTSSSSSHLSSNLSVNEKSFFSKNRKKNGTVSISMKIKGY